MKNHSQQSRRNFLAALCAAGAVRAFAEEPRIEVPVYNRMSDQQEIALGRETAKGIEREKNLQFVEAGGVRDYVDDMFRKIVKTCRRQNLPYSIKIVDTREINAFALPGGFVYLNRGLMEWAHSESELAATLSHEIGHVVGHHGANSFSRQDTADSLLTEASRVLLGDDTPAKIIEQVGGPVAALALLKYDRDQEMQADLLGYYNMQRAGWDARGMLELFQHFEENSSVLDPLFTITSDHPASSEREEQIRDEMRSFPPKPGLIHDTDRFRSVQAQLKKMPPPRVQEKLF